MEDLQAPPIERSRSLEESLERLRDHDSFRVVVAELRLAREGQFAAMKGQKKRVLHEIVGAISILDDLIAMFEGGG